MSLPRPRPTSDAAPRGEERSKFTPRSIGGEGWGDGAKGNEDEALNKAMELGCAGRGIEEGTVSVDYKADKLPCLLILLLVVSGRSVKSIIYSWIFVWSSRDKEGEGDWRERPWRQLYRTEGRHVYLGLSSSFLFSPLLFYFSLSSALFFSLFLFLSLSLIFSLFPLPFFILFLLQLILSKTFSFFV